MPIVKSLMKSLKDRYGDARGEQIYYAMEASGKGPFAPGAKYAHLHEEWAAKHGVKPIDGRRKGRRRRSARRPSKRR